MNEDLNLVEILKDCPEGTKLYSTVLGEVKLCTVNCDNIYPICVKDNIGNTGWLTSDGKFIEKFDGECVLFPSREERDWSKFKPKQPKFDPKTLMPFDKVLVRDANNREWTAMLFSHNNKRGKFVVAGFAWAQGIPYNEETKHLLGTREEAPEYYRYWEE